MLGSNPDIEKRFEREICQTWLSVATFASQWTKSSLDAVVSAARRATPFYSLMISRISRAGALLLLCAPFSAAQPLAALPVIAHATADGPPQIHGPRVVGATPGRPFLFSVGATGSGPLLYRARGLPQGLGIDERTGLISGAIARASLSLVQLEVSGPQGRALRNLVVIAGEHQLAQTPPMGWNSWNAFGCGVTEKRVRAAADELIETGLARRGYRTVNIDDCWQGTRDATGELRPNSRFGDLQKLGEALHARGLQFGIYSAPSPLTCAGFAGSYGHEFDDARSYARWGVDYLKYDYCGYDSVAQGVGRARTAVPFALMRRALDASGRDIVYSISQYGRDAVWQWAGAWPVGANLWRTSRDVKGSYGSVARLGFANSEIGKWAAPGRWNDPDMLFLHRLSPDAQMTQMTLWSLRAAPLLIGSDIARLSPWTLDLLSNSEVIEVDQDPLGIAARRVARAGSTQVWARPLWDGTLAVGLFNSGPLPADVAVNWSDLGIEGAQAVRDLWRQRDLGPQTQFAATVAPQGALLLKLGTPRASDWVPSWWRN